MQDDVVEVQGAGLPQAALILAVDPGDLDQAEIPRLLLLGQVVRGQQHGVLGPGDVTQHRPGRELLVVGVQVLHALLDDPQGIVRVVNGEAGGKAQLLDVPPQDAHTGGVEGSRPDVVGCRAQHLFQPLLQLPRRLVGKGDGQNGPGGGGLHLAQAHLALPLLPGGGPLLGVPLEKGQVIRRHPVGHLGAVGAPPVPHQVGHPVDQHGGLAAAGPRQQQQRPLGGQRRLLLLGIQADKIPGDGRPAGLNKLKLLLVV